MYGPIKNAHEPPICPEIIDCDVWHRQRFHLSNCDAEDLMAERGMLKLKSMEQAQRFLSAHAAVYNSFNVGRHLATAQDYRCFRLRAFASWERQWGQ